MFYRQVKNFLGGNLFVESRGTGVGLLEVSLTFFYSSISLSDQQENSLNNGSTL